jgi:hypothetical protein
MIDPQTKSKLASIKSKEKKKDEVAEATTKKQKAEQDEKNRKRAIAREQWLSAKPIIAKAIEEINAEVSEIGCEFSFEEKPNVDPATAQAYLSLTSPRGSGRERAVLNVNAYGLVQFVLLVPHTSRSSVPSIELVNLSKEKLTALMADFLEEVLDHQK